MRLATSACVAFGTVYLATLEIQFLKYVSARFARRSIVVSYAKDASLLI
jgi:hypothetical protein